MDRRRAGDIVGMFGVYAAIAMPAWRRDVVSGGWWFVFDSACKENYSVLRTGLRAGFDWPGMSAWGLHGGWLLHVVSCLPTCVLRPGGAVLNYVQSNPYKFSH